MAKSHSFRIVSEVAQQRAVVVPVGELDIATVAQLEHEVRALLTPQLRELIIDLRRLTFIDSSGLRLLIGLHREAATSDWELSLIRPSGQALRIFEITGALQHLPFGTGS